MTADKKLEEDSLRAGWWHMKAVLTVARTCLLWIGHNGLTESLRHDQRDRNRLWGKNRQTRQGQT